MIRRLMKMRVLRFNLKTKNKLIKTVTFILSLLLLITSIQFQNFMVLANSHHETYDVSTPTYIDDVPIQGEIIDQRDAYSKVFRKYDGTYELALYNEVIHYKSNGKWKQIDNSLEYNQEFNEYENKANSYKIKLPKNLKENKDFKLNKDNYEIRWNILGISESEILYSSNPDSDDLSVIKNLNQHVLYENIFENTDLEYILKGDTIKENFILKQKSENFIVNFEIDVKDLSVVQENNDIYFINENDEVIFTLGDYLMYDAKGQVSDHFEISINELNKDKYLLEIRPDQEWLNSSERVYPVVVDPNLKVISDTTNQLQYKTIPTTNPLNSNALIVGNELDINYRSFFNLTLPSLLSDKVITFARLELKTLQSASNLYCEGCDIYLKDLFKDVDGNNVNDISYGSISSTSQSSNSKVYDYTSIHNDTYGIYFWDLTKNPRMEK